MGLFYLWIYFPSFLSFVWVLCFCVVVFCLEVKQREVTNPAALEGRRFLKNYESAEVLSSLNQNHLPQAQVSTKPYNCCSGWQFVFERGSKTPGSTLKTDERSGAVPRRLEGQVAAIGLMRLLPLYTVKPETRGNCQLAEKSRNRVWTDMSVTSINASQ